MTDEPELGESKYDLRELERNTFGKMYQAMLESQMQVLSKDARSEDVKEFAAIIQTISQYLRHYATNEDMKDMAGKAEGRAERTLKRMSKNHDPQVHKLIDARDKVEEVRMDIGLKLPQETEVAEEDVMVEKY
jgi:ubiquinone biosynthesis protein Coq4